MPTGTGKTGVMAVLAQCYKDTPTVLIVAPWKHLVKQIAAETSVDFWKKLGMEPSRLKKALALVPVEFDRALAAKPSEEGMIFVCTNQALQKLQVAYADVYRTLKERVALVLVDEGHREPAPTWAKAVRDLQKPTVLFTATPYRNDWRLFDLDKTFRFAFYHAAAVKGRFIREVRFSEVAFADAETFVKALLKFYKGAFQSLKPSEVSSNRVIIRCADDANIRAVAAELRRQGESVIAVHDQFDNDDEYRHHDVPDPLKNDAQFWIHQNKLIEGLDDPRFTLLAVFQPFGNDRALVQQIGRIIRNPTRKPDQAATVFCNPNSGLRIVWENYLQYENWLQDEGHEEGPAELFAKALQSQAAYHYLEGNFRQRFDPKAGDAHLHLNYSRSTLVFRAVKGFDFSKCVEAIASTLDEENLQIENTLVIDPNTQLFIYVRCASSPLLRDQTFLELELGFAILRRLGDFIFYQDTQGIVPEYLIEKAEHVNPLWLERLLSGSDVTVSQVALLNSDLGSYSVRRRTLAAASIAALAPGLSDHAHFCSTVTALIRASGEPSKRRYVGFSRGRVSELASGKAPFDQYLGWLDTMAELLESEPKFECQLFQRFAIYSAPPEIAEPIHILFDITQIEHDLVLAAGEGQIDFEDRCWDVKDNSFECIVNGVSESVQVEYKTPRFSISSKGLSSILTKQGAKRDRRRTLVQYLNSEQAFRIITKEGTVYSNGHFYQPRFPLYGHKKKGRIDLLDLLKPCDRLGVIEEEKSALADHSGWSDDSVFGFIDNRAAGLFSVEGFEPDVLVCDDIGSNERADFIAIGCSPPRVVLIHAKAARKKSKLSASAFHEVCGQAVKNLAYLTPGNPFEKLLWDGVWTEKKGTSFVTARIRKTLPHWKAKSIAQEIERLVRQPATTREVWIVMARGLSKKAFDEARTKDKPAGNVIQMFYLLQSTWSQVSSVGAGLKIFCAP